MSWISIIVAIAFQIYRISAIRKDEAEETNYQTAMQETQKEVQAIQYEIVIRENE
jgi:hypothetical protein